MRFLVFGLLILTAVYVSESRTRVKRDTKDDLSKSVEQLRESVKKELDKLKAEGKLALAVGLEKADKLVEEVDAQLKKLNPTTEVGKALLATLEATLEKAKTKVEEEIKKLSSKFYDETVKDQLKNRINNLKNQAQGAIAKALALGKTVLAEDIMRLRPHIDNLEVELEKLNPQTEVGKALLKSLEYLIKSIEGKLEGQIKQLSGSFYDDVDVNNEIVLKQVGQIYDNAKSAIETLSKSGKKELANGLEKTIAFIKSIDEKVEALNPITDGGKLLVKLVEKLIKTGEDFLEADLKKAQGSFYEDANKEALIKAVKNVLDELKTVYEKLAKTDKKLLIERMTKLVAFTKEIQTELKTLHPTTDIGKVIVEGVEKLVNEIEGFLEKEIKALSGKFYDETTKDDLKKQLDNLKKQAQEEIQKLKAKGKTASAEGITKLEAHLVDLEAILEKVEPQTKLGKSILKALQGLVKSAETKLKEEIKKLSGSYFGDVDVRGAVLKQVSDLYDKIKSAIETLAKTDKKSLVTGLEEVIKFVHSVGDKVRTLKPTTDMGKTMVKLVSKLCDLEESLLSADLKKVQGSYYADDNKEALLKAVGQIFDEGKAAFEKLEKSDKKTLVDGLTKVVAVAKEIQTEFNALHPTTEIGKTIFNAVKGLVDEIEGFVEMQLKSLSGKTIFYAEDHKTILLKAVSELFDKTAEAIDTLTKKGDKKELVNGLEKAIKLTQSVGEKAKALKPTTDAGRSVQKLVVTMAEQGEALLNADLKKAQSGYYADAGKEALLKMVGQIYDEGKAALEKLAKTDKKALVEGLTKTIVLVEEVQKELKTLNPSTDLGKVILNGVEKVVAGIDAFLKEDLKTASVPAQ